ncbi:MAG: UDP-3-O-acyl-N-acetylglucosamine deacetylase [Succiniclasticum sp.]|nr:UDP-3-O-acyl-N-acetylglucosamine deacetylase [Succiniclasticum sp.]MEE3478736.1 UDP-3-O-acyl-N-acetylglucosamine deacetylase [Succiniclasticum sp.]
MQKQTTLAASISYSGNGLHSGKPVTMTLKPAAPDTGIVFIRTDLPDQPEIHAKAELVTSTLRATTISENGAQVFTVEHLLASLAMMHVDNCHIEMNSPEPPVADGSGLVFAQLVLKAGRKEQDAERKVYKVDRAFSVYDGDKYIVMLPYDGVRISFTSINPHPLLGTQYKDVELTEESFLKEIAPARTIGFMNEVEQMKKMGLGLGGNLENAVVYDDTKCLSVPRFPDELVRHKILDVLGDLFLLGPWEGHVIAVKSGHAYNSQLAKQIIAYREGK